MASKQSNGRSSHRGTEPGRRLEVKLISILSADRCCRSNKLHLDGAMMYLLQVSAESHSPSPDTASLPRACRGVRWG